MAWGIGHVVEAGVHGHVRFFSGRVYIYSIKYTEDHIFWQAPFRGTPTVSGRRINPIRSIPGALGFSVNPAHRARHRLRLQGGVMNAETRVKQGMTGLHDLLPSRQVMHYQMG